MKAKNQTESYRLPSGPIRLHVSPTRRILITLSIFIGTCIVALLWFGTYARKGILTGILVPDQGAVRIVAPTNGVMTKSGLRENSIVRSGETIAVLATSKSKPNGDTTFEELVVKAVRSKASIIDLQQRGNQDIVKGETAKAKKKQLAIQSEIDQLNREVELQKSRVKIAEELLEREQKLVAGGFLSESALLPKRDALLESRSRVESLYRIRTSMNKDLTDVVEDIRSFELKRRAVNAASSKDRIATEQELLDIEGRQSVAITAPFDGAVTGVLLREGDFVGGNQTLAWLMPQGAKLKAFLYASSTDVGLMHVGQNVKLRYRAFPHQKFGQHSGRIEAISHLAIDPKDFPSAQAPQNSKEPVFRITVEVDEQTIAAYGRRIPLVAGYQVDADVTLEERRLLEWMLGPFLAIQQRIFN